jgi:hypothetical protein
MGKWFLDRDTAISEAIRKRIWENDFHLWELKRVDASGNGQRERWLISKNLPKNIHELVGAGVHEIKSMDEECRKIHESTKREWED